MGPLEAVIIMSEKNFFIEKYEMPEICEMRLKTFSTVAVSNDPDEASACFNSCCFTRDDSSFDFKY